MNNSRPVETAQRLGEPGQAAPVRNRTGHQFIMRKPRYTDDDGEWVYEGDTITFSYGIPPVRVTGKIMNRSGTLWVLPHNSRTEGCPLRALRGYVGAWWKEEG